MIIRMFIILYGVGLFSMFIRLLALILVGEKKGAQDVATIILYPLYMLTEAGRNEISTTLRRKL